MRDGRTVIRVAKVLDRRTKVDQGPSFIQWNSADVFNEMDTSVGLVALLCNTEENRFMDAGDLTTITECLLFGKGRHMRALI